MDVKERMRSFESTLDTWLPDNSLQTALDDLREEICSYFSHPQDDSIFADAWHEKAIIFLSDLPYRALYSLGDMAYILTQITLYPPSHPLKTPFKLITLAIKALEEILKAENWIKFGASTIGSAIGYSVISPISPLALYIGMSMVVLGVSAKLLAQTQTSAREKISQSLHLIMTAAATSVCSWYALGRLQRAFLKPSLVS